MKLISILSILLIITSCNLDRRIARKQAKWCDKNSTSDTTIVIQNDTVVKETTKIVKIAPNPDTLNLYAIAYCDSMNDAQMPIITVKDKSNGHKASISIVDNELQAEIICNMDSLEKIIITKNTLIKNLKDTVINKVQVIKEIQKVGKFYIWFFWIFVILIILIIAFYLVKMYYFSKFKR